MNKNTGIANMTQRARVITITVGPDRTSGIRPVMEGLLRERDNITFRDDAADDAAIEITINPTASAAETLDFTTMDLERAKTTLKGLMKENTGIANETQRAHVITITVGPDRTSGIRPVMEGMLRKRDNVTFRDNTSISAAIDVTFRPSAEHRSV